MLYTELTKKAMRIAYNAHRGQVDEGGLPYILHPVHVAETMPDEVSAVAALLHDVTDKTAMTLEDLRRAGFPAPILETLRLLSRDKAVPYFTYIASLREHPAARRVKIAELLHDSDRGRLGELDERAWARLDTYTRALELLEEESSSSPRSAANTAW